MKTDEGDIALPFGHKEVAIIRRLDPQAEDTDSGDRDEVIVPMMHQEVSSENGPAVADEVRVNKGRAQKSEGATATVRILPD